MVSFRTSRPLQPVLTALLIPLCLWGCQAARSPVLETDADNPVPTVVEADTSWEPPPAMVATQPWRILVALKDTYDPATGEHGDLYQAQVWEGAQQAAEDFGVEVELLPNECHTCVESQIRAIAQRLERGDIDGIVIMVTDSVRLADVVEQAIARGVPVMAMDTPVNTPEVLSLVVFDNFTGGELMGQWVAHELNGKGNVLLLDGALSQQNALDRKQGFLTGLKTGSEIVVLENQSAEWSDTQAAELTTKWLDKYDQVDAIVAANYAMAEGAAQAVQAAGLTDQILVTGFDAMPDALAAIQAGRIDATINQQPDQQARLSLQLLIRHLETGETYPPQIFLPEIRLINQDNIGDMSSALLPASAE